MLILVVEDERKVANFTRQGLEEEGHTVSKHLGVRRLRRDWPTSWGGASTAAT